MVIDTVAAAQAGIPDTGDLDEDLRGRARSIHTMSTGIVSGALVRAVFTAGDGPDLRHLRHRSAGLAPQSSGPWSSVKPAAY